MSENRVRHNGNNYLVNGQAELSNRVFFGWWGDAQYGEEYTAEWEADGEDESGIPVIIRWQMTMVKGNEPEDGADWDFSDSNISKVYYQ